MIDAVTDIGGKMAAQLPARGHSLWVRLTHLLIAASVVVLIFSGFTIFKAHPRLYWGETGNDLTSPLVELPIGPNYKHGGWEHVTPFFASADSPMTADRGFEIYNQNGWARSLHFLVAWGFLASLVAYLALGIVSGHLRRDIVPDRAELDRKNLAADVRSHLTLRMPVTSPGPPYNVLQKLAYGLVVGVALPLMFLTGITMSPAIVASHPWLLDIFGGAQSARTLHFVTFFGLVLFVVVHLSMIFLTDPARQLRGMFLGTQNG
jgi:thiosulfate reductase cytochrome b subunit